MIQLSNNLQNWHLEPDELERANILSPQLHAKLQTINLELAVGLAEFKFEASGSSGVLLNAVDFWQLRGRRSLVIELLAAHDEATGQSQERPEPDDDNSNLDNQSRSF